MYEGYEQLLCQNGHYHIVDLHRQQSFWQHAYEMAYGSDEEEKNWRCPDCQAPLAWIHGVDTTNDAGDPAHLEIKTPAETCICTAFSEASNKTSVAAFGSTLKKLPQHLVSNL